MILEQFVVFDIRNEKHHILRVRKRLQMITVRSTTPGRSFRPVWGAVRWVGAAAPGNLSQITTSTRWKLWILVTLCVTTLAVSSAWAQTGQVEDLQRKVEELQAENAALKAELAELKAALRKLMAPPATGSAGPTVEISIAGLAARGSSDAPVTVVEFADYQNPDCARFHQETFPRIEEKYLRTGFVRFVFKNLPDEAAHPRAIKAHEAAACAGDQGRYWEMHDLLLADQAAVAPEQLIAHADTLGLDPDLFRYCLTSGAHVGMINRDVDEGKKGGVMLTPVFALGLTEPGRQALKVRRVVVGSQPYPVFEDAIEAVLSTAEGGQ